MNTLDTERKRFQSNNSVELSKCLKKNRAKKQLEEIYRKNMPQTVPKQGRQKANNPWENKYVIRKGNMRNMRSCQSNR